MVYSRCLYQVLLFAGTDERREYPITQHTIIAYISHVCHLLECQLVKLAVGNGCASLLFDLNANLAISDFIEKLRAWTSAWIMPKSANNHDTHSYWARECLLRQVSPEDIDLFTRSMDLLPFDRCELDLTEDARSLGMVVHDEKAMHAPAACHHIIIITSRARMLLPIKYRFLLADIMQATCSSLGMDVVECAAMHNHAHILGHLPSDISVGTMIDCIKARLLENMHANAHFRSFEGWADDALAYTVGTGRIHDEKLTVLKQDIIHRKSMPANEMSHLYQKMHIGYVTSLH